MVPQVQVLVNLTGTQWNPVKKVQILDVDFKAAAPTYMMPHGVPSAGDWALDRYGAIFMQGTEQTLVDGSSFERLVWQRGHGVGLQPGHHDSVAWCRW